MFKVGVLGGGQLGRMLLQAAANYPVQTYVLENDMACPAAAYCGNFIKGNIQNFADVYAFGKLVNILTIEIEAVNVEALFKLRDEGLTIIPSPEAIQTLQNKKLQKQYYTQIGVPTASYTITQTSAEVLTSSIDLPAVHKLAVGGYDGKGVVVINSAADGHLAFSEEAVLESKINIKKEISIIVGVAANQNTTMFQPVEMVFNDDLNVLDYQYAPAEISDPVKWKAEAIAHKVATGLQSPGVFAVELFVDTDDQVWVNETAPRVHNSGHHTIEACQCSQFDLLLAILVNYNFGDTKVQQKAAVVNILGAPGYYGTPIYEGLNDVILFPHTYVHIYGKAQTKPGRKMGHVTILSDDEKDLKYFVNRIKNTLKVISV